MPNLSSGSSSNRTATIVLGVLKAEERASDWVYDVKNIANVAKYIVDDPSAQLHLEQNRGREPAVYLKYILEHFDNLTDVTIFVHASSNAWHNNVLFRQELLPTLDRLQREYVMEKGYVNTRCEQYPGCPRWVELDASKEEQEKFKDRSLDLFTSKLWAQLFPEHTPPKYLAQPCCSQFAVSRDAIRKVPYSTYLTLSKYVVEDHFDVYTGRVMEYLWQYIFLGEGEVCPSISECYCKTYGLCFKDTKGLLDRYNRVREEEDEAIGRFYNKDALSKEELGDPAKDISEIRRQKAELEETLPSKFGSDRFDATPGS
ncbi:MAG: hypothetical protein M1831_004714 [Alyxoria varia]|nr:MAG: hypothetical protein M1831_004714 [Alyxoria varia]